MAEFEVKAVQIDEVTDHPNADRLSLNRIGGYIAISNKLEDGSHRYKAGDVVVYVPEGAVVPDYLLQRQGFWKDGKGTLAGSRGNRVKAIKLRGVLSQGLIIPPSTSLGWLANNKTTDGPDGLPISIYRKLRTSTIGEDYAEFLGIVKYEPPIPAGMTGDLIASSLTLKFDVENGQKYPDVFQDDDYVFVTEKIHGTFCAFVFANTPQEGWLQFEDNLWATAYSKGLGSKGLVFKDTEKNRSSNLYVMALLRLMDDVVTKNRIDEYLRQLEGTSEMLTIMGEIYGRGVQDLQYSEQTPAFAAFDIAIGRDYLDADVTMDLCKELNVPTVPLLLQGDFQDLDIEAHRDGKSAIDNSTLREGIVVRGTFEDVHDERIGRKMVKYVSPDYLTRKGGTELT